MKNFTKSLALILALVLTLTCVAGCSNEQNTEPTFDHDHVVVERPTEPSVPETTEAPEATDATEAPEAETEAIEETVDADEQARIEAEKAEAEAAAKKAEEEAAKKAAEEEAAKKAAEEAAKKAAEEEAAKKAAEEAAKKENNTPSVKYTSVNETVYATADVNVRAGAGTNFEKVGGLAVGESVTRIGVGDNGWSKVTYNGKTAYISSNYLTTTKPVEKPTEPVHTHTYVLTEVEATCTKGGYELYKCSCGDSYKGEEVNAKGHNYKVETVAPTTSAQGYDIHTCKTCGDSYKDNYKDKIPESNTTPTVPVHTHNYSSKVTNPTCTAGGYTTYTCDCGDSYKGNETGATGHNYKVETVAPTTSSEGYDLHTCKVCGDSFKDNHTAKLPEQPKNDGPIHTNSSVYNTLIGFKSKYPEGMAFDNSVNYSWSCPYNGSVIFYSESGCTAFASELSHAAFGVKDYATLYNITINDVRVGDILRINGGAHTVIVLEVYADHVVIAEANYGGKVHWGRTLTAEQVANASCLISRYSDRL